MYRKLKYLTKVSLKKKIATKWFIIVNLILAIAIISIANIDQIIKFFGGDFDEKIEVVVIDETKKCFDYFKNSLSNFSSSTDKEEVLNISLSTKTLDEILEEVPSAIVIELLKDDLNYVKAKITSKNTIDAIEYQQLTQGLMAAKQQYALSLSNIDENELAMVLKPLDIERMVLDNDTNETEDMTTIMGTVFPTLILPFFMLVIFLIQMIGTEINEEKTTRSMEIIISNVSPKVHFFSKVLASNIFVLTQGALLFIYGGVALLVRSLTSGAENIMGSLSPMIESLRESGFIDQLYYIIPLTLILLILSFLAYALISGILASMTVNMEDFQQIQAPVIFLCLIAYYLSIMAGMFHGSLLIRILSYVPFISCLLSPALLVLGQIGIIDVIISIVILILFNYLMIKFGMRIYKIGILNYSTDKMWSKLWKAIKSRQV